MIIFMDISSVLVTALFLSNAKSYAESIDLSIISHHYHHIENLCEFSIYALQRRCYEVPLNFMYFLVISSIRF